MPIITTEILTQGLELESKRSLVKNDNVEYDRANKDYYDWLVRYGYLLLTEFLKEKEKNVNTR